MSNMDLINISTKGHYDFINITREVEKIVRDSKTEEGIALVFINGSTAALTTMEYEDGLIEDLKNSLEKIAPEKFDYQHHQKWGDYNGGAHIKSAIIGPDLTVPIEKNKLCLGDWQQIVLIDFDERPRQRQVMIKIIS